MTLKPLLLWKFKNKTAKQKVFIKCSKYSHKIKGFIVIKIKVLLFFANDSGYVFNAAETTAARILLAAAPLSF